MTNQHGGDDRWFDVLTGKAEAENRDERIVGELRERVLKDAADDAHQLSELDLQRGKRALRAATQAGGASQRPPFFLGVAAGVFAAAFGLTVLNTQFDDGYVDKGLPDILAPTIEQTLPASVSVAELYALAALLAEAEVEHVLVLEGEATTLRFKSPAPVPKAIALQLERLGV
ncbi:MAG: hypothetical protein AAGF46_09460, partial [Pseudomonadota bacterium]